MKKTLTAVFCLAALGLTSTVALGDTASEKVYNSLYSERGNHQGADGTIALYKTVSGNHLPPHESMILALQKLRSQLPKAVQATMKKRKKAQLNELGSHSKLTTAKKNLNTFIKIYKRQKPYPSNTKFIKSQELAIKKLTKQVRADASKQIYLRNQLVKNSDYINYLKAEMKFNSQLLSAKVIRELASTRHKVNNGYMPSEPPGDPDTNSDTSLPE
jgi:hypothetical protein